MATAIYAVITPSLERATISVAGHPPPVLAEPDHPARLVPVSADLPLGAYRDAPRRTLDLAIPPGSAMFFYTDGLIERRYRPLDEGFGLLLAAVTPVPAEQLCATVMASLIRDEPADDDVAILAFHRADR
jgi:serine phosphatase RsbU (regulator of sigma subunit)